MRLKEKSVGIILILIGALSFFLKIDSISKFFTENSILSYMMPGDIIYQLVIILLGIILVLNFRPRYGLGYRGYW